MHSLLHIFEPFWSWLPVIKEPQRTIKLAERVLWTIFALFIYLICCQMPIYGINNSDTADPFYGSRVIFASNRASLMELGISPIYMSQFLIEMALELKIIQIDTPRDKILFKQLWKFLCITIAMGQAVIYIMTGMYGTLSLDAYVMIAIQLVLATIIMIMLDEMLKKGYGLGSGISLFIAASVCETVIWKLFSPMTIYSDRRLEFEGIIPSLFHLLFTRNNRMSALNEIFFRQNLPNMMSLMGTFIFSAIIIYLLRCRVELPLKSIRNRGDSKELTFELFYTSNMPIVLHSLFVSHFFIIAKARFGYLDDFLGVWSPLGVPIGGISYYLVPPENLSEVIEDPIHAVISILLMLAICIRLSMKWSNTSRLSPKALVKQLEKEGFKLIGYRDHSAVRVLSHYVTKSAAFSGFLIGTLSILAGFMGTLTSGNSIFIAITTIHDYIKIFDAENNDDFSGIMLK